MSRLSEALAKAHREGSRREPVALDGARAASTPDDISALRFLEGSAVQPKLEGCIAELLRDDEPWIEQLRTFATRLRAMEGSERVRRLGLMSATGGEGKTTLAIVLSLILAEEQGERVLLVDADLRQRDVEKSLGLKASPGLADWLKSPTPEVEVRRLGSNGPFFLGAGRPFAKPWELITSPNLGMLMDAARRDYRYVITDCPAEGPVADAAKLQEHLDGLLLVIRARTAPRDVILSTVEHLDESKILGVIFNAEIHARKRFKHYRYGGYYKSSKSKNKRR